MSGLAGRSGQRAGLVGQPLRRRHSQVMHDAAFAAAGINAAYELHEVAPDDLSAFVAGVRTDAAWLGFQITSPHKQAVVALLDEVEPDALAIGAVNSVERTGDGRLLGFNTDAPGFTAAVAVDPGVDVTGRHVVLIGAGGAARAVAVACLAAGATSLTVANRTGATAVALAGSLWDPDRARGLGLADPALPALLGRADLVVNATTVGMTSGGTPVDVAALGPATVVLDLVYQPSVTPLLAAVRARGLRGANGAGMLVAQAVIAWVRWTGAADPTDVMRAALDGMVAEPEPEPEHGPA